jgi:hypothetical protein
MALKNTSPMEGWILLADAARELGISRQSMHEAVEAGRVETAVYLGETRLVYAMRRAEIPEVRRRLASSRQFRHRRIGDRREIQEDNGASGDSPDGVIAF